MFSHIWSQVPHQCSELGKTAAGVPSVKQSLSQEPSFTRKRRVGGGGGSEMARESVLTQVKEETKVGNVVSVVTNAIVVHEQEPV